MTSPTEKARTFMAANDESKVIAGHARLGGGGTYRLQDGRFFDLTIEDARSLPGGYPKWQRGPY